MPSIIKNISYKSGGDITEYERKRCKLDLYLPDDARNAPVVLWFHGGGLIEGSKDGAALMGLFFAKHNIIAAVPNYRLFPEANHPSYTLDAAAATAWTIEHTTGYGGSSECAVFLSGHSAGAYLAATVGMDSRYLAAHGIGLSRVNGLIPVSGQMFTHFTIREERGIQNPINTPIIDEDAPAFYVTKPTPPVMVTCGDNDLPTRAEENRYFIAMLKYAERNDVKYMEFANRDHGTIMSKIPEEGDPEGAAILDFIEKYR